jgi:hypothetical protein
MTFIKIVVNGKTKRDLFINKKNFNHVYELLEDASSFVKSIPKKITMYKWRHTPTSPETYNFFVLYF